MSDLALGLQFIVTGMIIVFITLTIMSVSMWIIGLLLKEKKKETKKGIKKLEGFNENEIIALTLAICQYGNEKEEIELRFESVSNWKIQGRIESLGRKQ
ncbi:MAG: hypothetical protein JSV25_00895 [Spirochaetota bacterium]|nr:MAG: hypothetical protein JSV25_00895 [Spirochaetota bacterium]